ncbi:MAG TPA: ATP-binding protein [Ginsengibacter sp.]|nr:ATP-binding protein [Ginsengibacter sp.]
MANNDALKSRFKIKRPLTIYILYWFLLSYILAALVFWFIVLNKQNLQLSRYQQDLIDVDDVMHEQKQKQISNEQNTNTAQYIGEGITFILLIGAGAIFVFRAINRQFMQAEQQENFMMAITHELKTPIAITKLNLETLQKRLLNNEQQQKLISSTIQEANRLNALCNNMLLTSQIEAGGYKIMQERIEFSNLVKECVHDFIVRFPNRKIEMQLEERIFINGDLMLLQLAVNNLLDNAIKYSGKEDIVLLKMFQNDKEIHVQVIDEGPGISNTEREKIFEKYYRGSQSKTKGTGLGLYLTKKIVQAHNGSIKIENNILKGSNFEIILKE